MRPTILPIILSASISLLLQPVQAQSGADASQMQDQYLTGYTAFERGERLSSSGDLKGAIASFKETRRILSQIKSGAPNWNPSMVEMRLKRAGEKIAELEGRIARGGGGMHEEAPEQGVRGGAGNFAGNGGDASFEPPLPPGDDEELLIPNTPLPENALPARPSRPSREPRLSGGVSNDPIREIQERMSRLQEDLQSSRNELDRLRQEKDDLAVQLAESNKAREKSDQTQKVLQQRADMAEEKLADARTRNSKDSEALHILQAERDKARKALREVQIDREAAEEVRQQLATRLSKAQDKVAVLTRERDAANKNSAEADARIAAAQKKMDVAVADAQKKMEAAIKEKDALGTKLTEVSKERDDALAQIVKLKEAQKQVDKLVTENTQLMAKLSDAEKQITQFKAEGEQKEQQIAALKKEVGTVTKQLADVQKQSADYQTQMGDLKTKLEDTSRQLTQMKADTATSAAERKNLVSENELLRGVVLRQMKEQARRDQTRKLVMGELGKMEIRSKELLSRIDYLGQPVVKLSEKERGLFKKPQVEISDTEISLAAPKPEEAPAAAVASTEPDLPAAATPTEAAPAPAQLAPASTAQAAPAPAPAAPLPETSTPMPEAAPAAAAAPADNSIQLASLTTPAAGPLIGNKGADATSVQPGAEGTLSTADPKSSGVPTEFMPLVQEAKDHFERNNYRDAEKIYEKILAKAPTNLYALSNLGVVRFRSGKLKLAEEAFKKAIAAAPEDGFSHGTLGIVYYSQGKYDEAVNSLTKALAINPKNATAHNYLGITASQKGWQEAAQKELETATALDPNYADAHFNLAVVFATQQPPNKENARKHYKRATELGAEPDSSLENLLK